LDISGKQNINKYTDVLIYLFLGLAVFTSQFSIATSSIGIGGLLILTVFKFFISENKPVIDKTLLYLFAAFILVQVISSAVCGNPADSFDHIYRKISIYIVFFAAIFFIKDINALRKLIIIFLIFSALISTIEIIRFTIDYLQSPPKSLTEFRLQYFGYPITNGEIKMTILLIIIPFFLVKKNYLMSKLYLALLSLPVFITFYLTNARNAFLALSTSLVVLGILKNRYFLAGLVTVTVLFLAFAPSSAKERILSIADLNHPSNHARFVMWDTGIKIIKDNLLLGVGDVDNNMIYKMYKKPEFHGEGSHMHNNVLQILVNFGIAGLAAWLSLMIYIFYRQVKVFRQTASNELLNLFAIISVIVMISLQISGLTEWNFGDAEYAAVFWFGLALAFLAARFYTTTEQPDTA